MSPIFVGAFALGLLIYAAVIYFNIFILLYLAASLACIGVVATFCAVKLMIMRRDRVAIILMAVVVATWLIWVFAPLGRFGAFVRFKLEREQYASTVLLISSGAKPKCLEDDSCQIVLGPPLRVRFYWGGLGNWFGIVYDPSGDIIDVDKHPGIFGSIGGECRRMDEEYFICAFI